MALVFVPLGHLDHWPQWAKYQHFYLEQLTKHTRLHFVICIFLQKYIWGVIDNQFFIFWVTVCVGLGLTPHLGGMALLRLGPLLMPQRGY